MDHWGRLSSLILSWLKAVQQTTAQRSPTVASCFHLSFESLFVLSFTSVLFQPHLDDPQHIYFQLAYEVSHLLPIIESLAGKRIFTAAATPSGTLSLTLSKSNGQRNTLWNIKGTTRALSHIYGNVCCLKGFLPGCHFLLCVIHLKVTAVSVRRTSLCSTETTYDIRFCFLTNLRKNSLCNKKLLLTAVHVTHMHCSHSRHTVCVT